MTAPHPALLEAAAVSAVVAWSELTTRPLLVPERLAPAYAAVEDALVLVAAMVDPGALRKATAVRAAELEEATAP